MHTCRTAKHAAELVAFAKERWHNKSRCSRRQRNRTHMHTLNAKSFIQNDAL
jgi:hypothetical protein